MFSQQKPTGNDSHQQFPKFSQDSNKLFSQTSQLHQMSSLGSSNSPSAKVSQSRFDEALAIKRHKEVMACLGNICSTLETMDAKLDQQKTTLLTGLELNQSSVLNELKKIYDAVQTNHGNSHFRSEEDSQILSEVLSLLKSNPVPSFQINTTSVVSAAEDDPYFSSSQSDDGVCLTQYLQRKNAEKEQRALVAITTQKNSIPSTLRQGQLNILY